MGFFNRTRICPICGEQYCIKCETQGRVCPNCGLVVPPDILQKYRTWDVLVPIFIYIIALICVSYSLYIAPPWPILPWEQVWSGAIENYLFMAAFLFLSIIALVIPQIGTKKFRKWVANSSQRSRIIDMMEKKIDGKYESPDKLFILKTKFWDWLNSSNYLAFLVFGVLLNLLWIFANIFRFTPEFVDFSVGAGIVAIISIVFNFLIITLAYSKKNYWGGKPDLKHLLIRGFLAFCLFGTILSYGCFIYYILVFGGIFPGPPDYVAFLRGFVEIGVVVVHGLFIILIIFMIFTRNFTVFGKSDINSDSDVYSHPNLLFSLTKLGYRFLKPFILIILTLFFILAIILTIYIAIGDIFMVITFFNLNAVIGLYIPIMIGFMVIVKKNPHKGQKQFFWTIFRVFGLLILVNLVPIAHTTIITNSKLDSQFATVFGSNWEENIPEEYAERLRPYRYSLWDNIYGYNFPSNAKYNISYTTDTPLAIQENTTTRIDTFYFDAYLPSWVKFGNTTNEKLPVLILMHGEVEDFGPWNANMSSQIIANMGFLVCDMNYGYITVNEHGVNNYNGYYLRQVVEQIGRFTKFLANQSDYFHADLSRTYFSGRHLGGGYALICGLGYNKTLEGVFAPEMNVKGIISYYPKSDLGQDNTGLYTIFSQRGYPFMNGSSDPTNSSYDPNWKNLNPISIIDNTVSPSGTLAPVLFFSGTHDYLITMRYSERFISKMDENGHTIITGFHLLGSDGYDGAYLNVWGQSCLFYMLRFLALTI